MILTCPECKTRYIVNATQLMPDGRVVRCAKCSATWRAPAPGPEDLPQERPEEATDNPAAASLSDVKIRKGETPLPPIQDPPRRVRPIPRGSNLPAIHKPRRSPVLGWLGLVVFIVIVIGSAYIFRNQIATAWPPSQRLYTLLGIEFSTSPTAQDAITPAPAPQDVLSFQGLGATPRYDGNTLVLTFKGRIDNASDSTIALPKIKADAQDETGKPLKDWTFNAETLTVPAHGSITFSTDLRDAPAATRRIVPSFATGTD